MIDALYIGREQLMPNPPAEASRSRKNEEKERERERERETGVRTPSLARYLAFYAHEELIRRTYTE